MEEPVTFKNRAGQTLFGILHIPDHHVELRPKVGINLLNPGLKNRVAPNRLNIKIARMLCERGFFVLRFDPHGIGDSEGVLPDDLALNLWGHIQKGSFVEDTLTANNYLIKKCLIQHLILIGSCGGAITALLSSAKDKNVKKLILIDLPVIISSDKRRFKDRIISSKEAENQATLAYLNKLIAHPSSWLRFCTGKSDYSAIWTLMNRKLPFKKKTDKAPAYDEINFNHEIPVALDNLLSRKVRIDFLLADNDNNTQIFMDKFQKPYLTKGRCERFCKVHVIQFANHIYTLEESQANLMDYVLNSLINMK